MPIISISSEDVAWEVLRGLLDGSIPTEDLIFDFSSAKWAHVHVNFKGEQFHQTVTASVMRGMLEYQTAFNKVAALLWTDDAKVSKLTLDQRTDLEFVFKVSEGSSDLIADAIGQLRTVGERAVERMSGREIAIAVIVCSLVFCGGYVFNNYVERQFEDTKQSRQLDADRNEKKDLYEFLLKDRARSEEQQETLRRALEESAQARKAAELSRRAVDDLIRNNSDADQIVIQGEVLDRDLIASLVRGSRSSAKPIVIEDIFTVDAVISESVEVFTVRLKRSSNGELITASLDDPLLGASAQRAISRAQWNAGSLKVTLSARRFGDQLRDAKILKAYKPRAS